MERVEIYGAVKEAIRRVLQVYEKEIVPEATLETDLGADSIDLAQVFQLVEAQLGVAIEGRQEDLAALTTVADVVSYVEVHGK